MPTLGLPEIIIIAVVILVLFGGAKLAGLGKSTGRAIREFKEETKSLKDPAEDETAAKTDATADAPAPEETERRAADTPPEITRGPAAQDTETQQQPSDEAHPER